MTCWSRGIAEMKVEIGRLSSTELNGKIHLSESEYTCKYVCRAYVRLRKCAWVLRTTSRNACALDLVHVESLVLIINALSHTYTHTCVYSNSTAIRIKYGNGRIDREILKK